MTEFEILLQQFSPDIYKLHKWGETESHLWTAINAIMDMRNMDVSGELRIRFSNGHIDKVTKQEELTHGSIDNH